MDTCYATDYIESPAIERSLPEVVAAGYQQDLVVFFPRCFVPEICPAERFRGYFLCTDNEEKRCRLTYRQTPNEVCRLGEYTLLSKRLLQEHHLSGKVLVIPGGRQIIDVCLVHGLPRAVIGVACPPDLKEGREKMESLGVRTFLVPVTKLEYEVKDIRKPTVQSCYENVVKNGIENYVRIFKQAVEYVLSIRAQNLSAQAYLNGQAESGR
ncbi:MAG: hypothetical protein A2293_04875 [Elusimicrobia bacterium RIFOXYB2_FULL_49_7]|nr:MAG: hypothetical protein A2293_04875 [Elusimicrobia bacterium RIFOXYB2_FULL_49_7]